MRITALSCDLCGYFDEYPQGLDRHFHPEHSLNAVPVNFWTLNYTLPSNFSNLNHGLDLCEGNGILRFKNYLPIRGRVCSLGEGFTPLVRLSQEEDEFFYLKDEGYNPTGSFKDRGTPLLVSEAVLSGKKVVAIPSTGNAALSLVRYSEAGGLDSLLFIPEFAVTDSSSKFGKNLVIDRDLIRSYEHFFEYCNGHPEVYNGFPVTNVPYYHGIKTLSFELFLQLGGVAPDWVVMPCGSGVNLVSQYLGFSDLLSLKLINKMPRFVSVQIHDADPITQGFFAGVKDKLVVLDNPFSSLAEAIASDTCFNYFKIIDLLNRTSGLALSVSDSDISETYSLPYPDLDFSSRAVYAVLPKLKPFLHKSESVVLIGTARSRKNELA